MRTPAKKWLYNSNVGDLQLKNGFGVGIITVSLLFQAFLDFTIAGGGKFSERQWKWTFE